MNSPVAKIKERLGIEEIASSYIKLERAGANLKAKCPFHNEKTPSFFISPDRGTYYCFGCGASGDIFTFVEEFEGLDFKGALKLLAERAGVELPRYNKEAESEKEKLYRAMEEAAKFFEKNLTTETVTYLKERGLKEETIKSFRIGFARNEWRGLYEHLSPRFTDIELERAGLIKKNEGKLYDRFRNRIIFPITDSSSRIIAFSGRIWGEGEPKYLNSPETPIFSKNAVLYGIDRAKSSIRKNNFSILVEGQMDLIMSHQAGYRNAVATSGTALSDSEFSKENAVSNLGLVHRLSPNIVLAFDTDSAGEKATERAGKIALSLGMDVKVTDLAQEKDPADLIKSGGAEAWRGAVKNSKHIIEFITGKILGHSDNDSRKAGRTVREKVLPFVASLQSSIEKAHFLKKISDTTGIPESALKDDFKKIEAEQSEEREEVEETQATLDTTRRRDYIERKLLGIALWQESLSKPAVDFKEIFEKLGEAYEKYKDIKEDLIFEAEVLYAQSDNLGRNIEEMFLNLEEENINEQLNKKMMELRQAGNEKIGQSILKEISELNKRKEEIKNSRVKNK